MQIEKLINLMQTDDSADAPADAIKRVRNIFRESVSAPKRSLLQRIVAVLQADLSPNKAVFGERSASALKSRQLLYTAGDTGIDLRVTNADDGRFIIHGQLLGDGLEYTNVKLFNDEHSGLSKADEFGDFEIRSVVPGTYSLSLTGGAKEIYIEKIELR
jgi:hypothetical protein